MSESIEEVIFPALSLIFLLLGIALIAQIMLTGFNPYDQIAVANTERLRGAINEACVFDRAVKLSSFELKQNKPSLTWIFTILPRWMIRSAGDPNYMIYYEAFPPGEAIGWEAYQDFNKRLIVSIPDTWNGRSTNGMGGLEVQSFIDETYKDYITPRPNDLVDVIIVSNIILSGDFRSDYLLRSASGKGGGPVEDSTGAKAFFAFGGWKNADPTTKLPGAGDAEFKFSNYLGLSNLEKTSIKYIACGDNSLCLKTRSYVKRYPLAEECKDAKAMMLVYAADGEFTDLMKATGYGAGALTILALTPIAAGTGGTGLTVSLGTTTYLGYKALDKFLTFELAYKISDFSVVSPCKLEGLEIIESSCLTDTELEGLKNVSGDYSLCQEAVKSTLYEYVSGTGILSKIEKGEHYTCLEKIGGSSVAIQNPVTFTGGDKCIQIKTTKPKQDYCWTPDPYKEFPSNWGSFFKEFFFSLQSLRQLDVWAFGLTPITTSTDYFSNDGSTGVILKPTGQELAKGETLFQTLKRAWWWGWP